MIVLVMVVLVTVVLAIKILRLLARVRLWNHPSTKKELVCTAGIDCGLCGYPRCVDLAKARALDGESQVCSIQDADELRTIS